MHVMIRDRSRDMRLVHLQTDKADELVVLAFEQKLARQSDPAVAGPPCSFPVRSWFVSPFRYGALRQF